MSKTNRLLQIFRGEWLIEPSAISQFAPVLNDILQRNLADFDQEDKSCSLMFIASDGATSFSKSSSQSKPVAGSVAVISISGAIMKYDNCGDAGTQTLGSIVKQLDADPNIGAIVLKVDSPGGTVAGTEDFANIIRSVSKPIISYVDGTMCSAAYWLGSSTNEIYAGNKTDQIGSIGTMLTFQDIQPALEKLGVKFHEIYADASSDKNKEFLEARNDNYKPIKEKLNAINEVFTSSVIANRGKNLNQKQTLTGKVFMAEDAVSVGLIDGIKSFDEVLLRARELAQSNNSINNNSTQSNMKVLSKFTAIASFLASAFPGFKAEETVITEDHLEKMNAELATLDTVKADLKNKETELSTAQTSLTEATNELTKIKNEFETFKKSGAGSTQTLKEGTDDIETNGDEFLTSVDREAAAMRAKYH